MGLTKQITSLPSLSQRERWFLLLGEKVRMRADLEVHLEFLQIASPLLFFLKRLEQGFEIAFAETLRAFALDDFKEERRPILHRLW